MNRLTTQPCHRGRAIAEDLESIPWISALAASATSALLASALAPAEALAAGVTVDQRLIEEVIEEGLEQHAQPGFHSLHLPTLPTELDPPAPSSSFSFATAWQLLSSFSPQTALHQIAPTSPSPARVDAIVEPLDGWSDDTVPLPVALALPGWANALAPDDALPATALPQPLDEPSAPHHMRVDWPSKSLAFQSVVRETFTMGVSLHPDRAETVAQPEAVPQPSLLPLFQPANPPLEAAALPPAWSDRCFYDATPNPAATEPLAQSLTPVYQLVVNQQVVAEFPTETQAIAAQKRFTQWVQAEILMPASLTVQQADAVIRGKGNRQILFEVDETLSDWLGQDRDAIAITWINNVRRIFNEAPLDLVDTLTHLYEISPTGEELEGTASWYGPYFHGRLAASGEYFDENELTAAHPSLPFDTYLKVTNLNNNHAVIVRINDRGPYIGERSLDLSRGAARCLGSEFKGVVPYQAIIMTQH